MKSTVVLIASIAVAVLVVAVAFLNRPEPEVNLPIRVEEYSDYNCSHCRDFQPLINQLKDDYQDNENVEVVSIPNPILGNSSEQAAFAATAAGRQGKFEEYNALLFENFDDRTEEDYIAFAEELELDIEQFNADREDPELQEEVLDQLEENQAQGITSTPTLLINDKRDSSRDIEELRERIDELVEIGQNQESEE
jgi:protein-disulfide isomerase